MRFRRSGRPKWGNRKVVYDGYTFDSTKEKDRYVFLKEQSETGAIRNMRMQEPYELIPPITEEVEVVMKTKTKMKTKTIYRATVYKADFVYDVERDGTWVTVVEDVKGSKATLTKEFMLKLKMMKWIHGIDVKLIYNATKPIE